MRSKGGRANDKPIKKHTLCTHRVCGRTGAILHDPQTEPTVFRSPPNGLRYPLVGGTRERRFAGTNFKPRKLSENAQTPTSRVHAVLGAFDTSIACKVG
jgi:hypothetical protein